MTKRYLTRASAVVLVVLGLAGCSWRVDTPPPAGPSPDPLTQVRDAAAEREHLVASLTSESDVGGTPVAVVLNEVEHAHAPLRLEALGGLYEPYPDLSPSPSPAPADMSLGDAVRAARDGHLAAALVTEDDSLALLLGSAGLSHALSGWYAQWVADAIGAASEPVVAERTLPSDAIAASTGPVPDSASISAQELADLALMHDQARYAYEVMAAKAIEDERDQWLARRDIQAARAEAFADIPGVEDLREATYVVLADSTADPAVRVDTARDIEHNAGSTYVGLLAQTDVDQWPWLLHAAFDAYAQAAAYGEPTAADYPVPALPGIDVT